MLQALIQIEKSVSRINIALVLGDGTGTLHTRKNDKYFIEFSEFFALRSSPPTNIKVDSEGEIWLSQDFRVIGKGRPAISLYGHIAGVHKLTLSQNRQISIFDTASNSRLIDGKYVNGLEG